MRCKLDSTEKPRSFEKYPAHLNRRILNTIFFAQHEVWTIFWHIVLFCFVSVGQYQFKSLKVGSRFQFTREIALNDKYLSQYFPKRKVRFIWMTLKQLLKIYIKLSKFDCMKAIFRKLRASFAICATSSPIWGRHGPNTLLHGQIESIKCPGDTSQKVTWTIWSRRFLESIIAWGSDVISRVNPLSDRAKVDSFGQMLVLAFTRHQVFECTPQL